MGPCGLAPVPIGELPVPNISRLAVPTSISSCRDERKVGDVIGKQ